MNNSVQMNGDSQPIQMRFGQGFLRDYASRLVNDPEIAIVEIVSNCWDAGANRVDIIWPDKYGGEFSIADNGIGMTYDEFTRIWSELSYNRADQGKEVTFPIGNRRSIRKIFGRNGKGRLSLFCFDEEYSVVTIKDGEKCHFQVTQQSGSLFTINLVSRQLSEGHGTTISCLATYNYINEKRLTELIGSKFVTDPAFEIYVNDTPIELTDLSHISENQTLEIPPYGSVEVFIFDSQKRGRVSQHNGVAWWVNKKGVGKHGWRGPNSTSYIDARTSEAKRYTFIVVADILEDQVEYDWTGFIDSEKSDKVITTVNEYIQTKLNELFFEKRKDRSQQAIKYNRERLKPLPTTSRQRVEKFVDELQTEIPTLNQEHLNAAVKVFANLEEARTGYLLLQQLAKLSPADVDALTNILETWSVRDAQIVLEELERRLKLIEMLDEVVDNNVDELHIIHPLVEKGLWIFGPEYESIGYTSNKGLTNVIRNLIGDHDVPIKDPRKRPDFVVLPNNNGQIEVFARDSFDDNGEVDGIEKVLLVELKKGGSTIGKKEIRQAEDYAEAISKSGNLIPTAKIVCYVLGTNLGDDAQKRKVGNNEEIIIEPRTYRTLIQQAQARTFYLKQKIEKAKTTSFDTNIDKILLIK